MLELKPLRHLVKLVDDLENLKSIFTGPEQDLDLIERKISEANLYISIIRSSQGLEKLENKLKLLESQLDSINKVIINSDSVELISEIFPIKLNLLEEIDWARRGIESAYEQCYNGNNSTQSD